MNREVRIKGQDDKADKTVPLEWELVLADGYPQLYANVGAERMKILFIDSDGVNTCSCSVGALHDILEDEFSIPFTSVYHIDLKRITVYS